MNKNSNGTTRRTFRQQSLPSSRIESFFQKKTPSSLDSRNFSNRSHFLRLNAIKKKADDGLYIYNIVSPYLEQPPLPGGMGRVHIRRVGAASPPPIESNSICKWDDPIFAASTMPFPPPPSPPPPPTSMRATYGSFGEHPMNAMSRCFDWAAAFDGSLLDGWMDVQDTRRTHSGKRDGELGHRGPFATVFNLFLCVRVEW